METVKFTELDIKPEILKACLLKKKLDRLLYD